MIDDAIMPARLTTIGTITVGTTNERGHPQRSSTFVFHTDDDKAAKAVQGTYGGTVVTEQGNWQYDVVTDVTEFNAGAIPAGFRQWMEQWATAKCLRRCTGTRMVTRDGKPTDEPCLCAAEGKSPGEVCSPSTAIPLVVDLPRLPRLSLWDLKSTAFGSARNLKDAYTTMQVMVADPGVTIPVVVRAVGTKVRDRDGKVWDTTEMSLTVAAGTQTLAQIGTADEPQALDSGDDPERRARAALIDEFGRLIDRAKHAGVYDQVRADWDAFRDDADDPDPAALDSERLGRWVDLVRSTVEDAEASTTEGTN